MCLFKNIILYLVAVPMVSIAWVTAVQMRKCENKLEMCVWKLIIHLLMWLFMQEQHCTHKKHCGPRLWYSLFISLRHSVHVQFQLDLVLPKPDQPYCLLRLRPWCCLLITWMFNFRVSWQGGDGLVDAHCTVLSCGDINVCMSSYIHVIATHTPLPPPPIIPQPSMQYKSS